MVVAALMYGLAGLASNGGLRPLLKFDGITNAAEPCAFNLNYGQRGECI
ncbi:hypothetical protein CLV25_1154 [Acetobacteroides hydrogenigenes]|uniref:Uncharacterized protein n=1 Tax=Acetobacteroides hydrogenigenes TaxID=979970 RepID=A0A4R2ECC2_9BACT|nr:hypothetical protein CLV25_1154 [Acetobacteroides hydrogenigenes]